MRAYLDADVLIWVLRGEPKARALLDRLADEPALELRVAAMQRVEVLFGARPGEVDVTLTLLDSFGSEPLTADAVDLGARYYWRYHRSHGTGTNDALLAALCAQTGGRIVTQNVRHFPMTDVLVQRGWD